MSKEILEEFKNELAALRMENASLHVDLHKCAEWLKVLMSMLSRAEENAPGVFLLMMDGVDKNLLKKIKTFVGK